MRCVPYYEAASTRRWWQVVARCKALAASSSSEGAAEWLRNVADSEIRRVDLQS